jgi:parvulin-like peptidyl-prolyl isomerase
MPHSYRRVLWLGVVFAGSLGLLAILFLLFAQPPQAIAPSPLPPTPTPQVLITVNNDRIYLEEWRQAVALDQALSALLAQPTPSPQDTLDRLVNEHLVLDAATEAGIPKADARQAEDWIKDFIRDHNLSEDALTQALDRAGLTRQQFLQEIVPRLLHVQRALEQLPVSGDPETWITELRRNANIEMHERLPQSSQPAPP